MKDSAFPQYKGFLNSEQIAQGMNAARSNAERLVQDAEAMFDRSGWASAAMLAVLSIEESGKANILRSIAVAREDDEVRSYWREYRSHVKKNVLGGLPDLVRAGANSIEDFRSLFGPNARHPIQIEQLKQISTYSDCYGEGIWSDPSRVVDKELAQQFIATANIVLSKHLVTARELDLWIEHVGPVWKQSTALMKQAVANWYDAMLTEKLIVGSDEDMNRFLWPSSADEAGEEDI